MEDYISAIQSSDLVKAKKAFGPIIAERISSLIEARKVEIAREFMIEGEEPKDEDEDEEKDKKDRHDDADEGDDDEDEDDE